jgi:hypothetical protein
MSLEYYRQYGPLYEFVGFRSLDESQRVALDRALRTQCLAAGFAVGGDIASGHVEVIGDRSSGFPVVYLEITTAECLIACDMGPPARQAWSVVTRTVQPYGTFTPVQLPAT